MAVPMALLKDYRTDSLRAHGLASMMGAARAWCLVGLMVDCLAHRRAHLRARHWVHRRVHRTAHGLAHHWAHQTECLMESKMAQSKGSWKACLMVHLKEYQRADCLASMMEAQKETQMVCLMAR